MCIKGDTSSCICFLISFCIFTPHSTQISASHFRSQLPLQHIYHTLLLSIGKRVTSLEDHLLEELGEFKLDTYQLVTAYRHTRPTRYIDIFGCLSIYLLKTAIIGKMCTKKTVTYTCGCQETFHVYTCAGAVHNNCKGLQASSENVSGPCPTHS